MNDASRVIDVILGSGGSGFEAFAALGGHQGLGSNLLRVAANHEDLRFERHELTTGARRRHVGLGGERHFGPEGLVQMPHPDLRVWRV